MWAVARYDLNLPTAEFWHLTPRELHALIKRRESRESMEDYRAGLVAAILANEQLSRSKEKREPYTPASFFPSLRTGDGDDGVETPEKHAARMKAKVKSLHAIFGGTLREPSRQVEAN